MSTKSKPIAWKNIRQQLKEWDRSALMSLVKDLYDLLPENRDFIHARFQAEDMDGAALEKYRRRIIEQFFPKRGLDGELKLSEARKAIRDYLKATGNMTGIIELQLTYVESGTKYTVEFGDIDAPFYDSLESVGEEMRKNLMQQGAKVYEKFRERIKKLGTHAHRIGWGYGDYLGDLIYDLEDKLGNSSPNPSKQSQR